MGFLDQLKQQAGDLQSRQQGGVADRQRRVQLVEAAARSVRQYLMELAEQLDVIRPVVATRYVLDRQVVLDGLPRTEFRFDARRKIVQEHEVIDRVVLACHVRSGRHVRLAKDFVNEIEQLEGRLNQAAVPFDQEAVRHPDSGKLVEMRYDFVADVQLSCLVQCDHEQGLLHFTLRNLDGLETVTCAWPAHEVTQGRLDDLARWWVGEPQRFLDGALNLRRVEAR